MSADLIKRLRDELQSLCAVVQSLEIEGTHIFVDASLIAEADAHLKRGGWARVEDALPVVPEGQSDVNIWIWVPSNVDLRIVKWHDFSYAFSRNTTQWRYAEPTPQLPEQTK